LVKLRASERPLERLRDCTDAQKGNLNGDDRPVCRSARRFKSKSDANFGINQLFR